MRHTVAAVALAGLAASAWGQGVTLHFAVDVTAVNVGDVANWTVSASFTGYPDASAYFGGFNGSFVSTHAAGSLVFGWNNLMSFEGTTPMPDGGTLNDVNIFNAALLGTDDPSNPIDIFTFEMQILDVGVYAYDVEGVASVFPDDGIFTLADEFTQIDVSSASVIVPPTPGAGSVLVLGGLFATRRRR